MKTEGESARAVLFVQSTKDGGLASAIRRVIQETLDWHEYYSSREGWR